VEAADPVPPIEPPAPEQDPTEAEPVPEAPEADLPPGVPEGVTVYTDPASGARYYIDPETGDVRYLPAEGSP
jgi:hypothetical protein